MWADAAFALRRRPRVLATSVLMAAVGAALMVGIGTVNRSTSAAVLDRLAALGADTWTVGPPESGATSVVLAGAASRATDLPGVSGALVLTETGRGVTLGPVAQGSPETVPLVGLEWSGELPALELMAGRFDLDPALPLAVVGPRAAELLDIRQLPTVVFADGDALVVTGVVRGDSVHAPLVRGVLVDRRWLDSRKGPEASGPGGKDKTNLLVAMRTDADPAALKGAANPVNPEGLSVSVPVELAAARRATSRTLVGGQAMLVVVAYVTAGVAIALLFGALTRSRSAEIGVRRCFGAPLRAIVGLVVAEGVLVGIVGATLGALAGLAVGAGWAGRQGLPVAVEWADVALAALFGCLTVVVASLPPAILAARTDPATAVGTAV